MCQLFSEFILKTKKSNIQSTNSLYKFACLLDFTCVLWSKGRVKNLYILHSDYERKKNNNILKPSIVYTCCVHVSLFIFRFVFVYLCDCILNENEKKATDTDHNNRHQHTRHTFIYIWFRIKKKNILHNVGSLKSNSKVTLQFKRKKNIIISLT